MARMQAPSRVPNNTRSNVAAIVKLEEEQDRRMSRGERFSGSVIGFVGSIAFVVLQIAFVAVWAVANVGMVQGLTPFDPPPFPLLWGIFSFESVLLTAFVLIRQDRIGRKAEHRSHLDLQINLLSEQAATKVIQMLDRMSKKLGIESDVIDQEAKELAKETEIENVSRELRNSLEGETPPTAPRE